MATPIQNNFEMVMNIFNREYTDCPLFAFFRMPLAKNASFSYAIVNMDITMYVNIQKMIARNEFPNLNTKIWSSDQSNPLKMCRDNRISKIYDRDLYCLSIQTDDDLDYKNETVSAKLLLVNPLFYQLEKRNTYNTIDNNKTVYTTLKDFEGYLTKTFGDVFKFRHIISEQNKNNTKMEQLLIRTDSDISIPEFLNSTYKPALSPSFYFFDDFYLDKDSDKEITCHFISLSDINLFKTETDNNNIQISTTNVIKEEPFYLPIKDLYDPYMRAQSEGNNKYEKDFNPSDKGKVPTKSPSGSTGDIKLDGNNIKIPPNSKVNYGNAEKPQATAATDEGTEDPENAKKRSDRFTKTIDKIKSMVYCEISKCLPWYPQFGKLYSVNLETANKFDVTPLNIVNMFVKRSGKDENTMDHMAKVVFIRYGFSSDSESIPSIKV